MIKSGNKAPEFCLNGIDEAGQEREFCLSDLLKLKKQIVLYFYPKDNTPGCTQEACDFRDNLNRLAVKAMLWSSVLAATALLATSSLGKNKV
jgi:peroxiredoxin Q/BCP